MSEEYDSRKWDAFTEANELRLENDQLRAENADLMKRLETMQAADPDPYGLRVLTAIDQLRRDLSGYHGHLKAHNDLQTHCDRQRERIACLEGLYIKVKAENAKLKEQTIWMAQTDSRWEAAVRERDQAKAENARLREKLETEREDNGSIRRLFDAVAQRCGRPDCPSLVEYVQKLRELVAKMARALGVDSEWCHRECKREFGCDCGPCPIDRALLELGIEVDA